MKTKPKPRLSMKLLWEKAVEYLPGKSNAEKVAVSNYLKFVEKQMKPLKP